MSRNFIPAVIAIGMGILGGYYTFQPALQELQSQKRKTQLPQAPVQSQNTQLNSQTSLPDSTQSSTPSSQETK